MSVSDPDVPPELTWANDAEPGIRRRRSGRGFSYRTASGALVTEVDMLARIKALAIPPAWTDVWICSDPRGHLQATGRDAKGRKQYRYHPRFRAHRDAAKFDKLYDFGRALPLIRRQVARDLDRPGMPKEKVVATIVRLLESTLARVGNEEYARENGSFGLTTLRDEHAKFTRDGVRLAFTGKHGIAADVRVDDRRLRRIVKQCQDLPGQVLFQYVDDDGEIRPATSTDVNDYLRAITGAAITAKDFRTWMGTLVATAAFASLPPPEGPSDAKRAVARVSESVAKELGNTPKVARASYVHPFVVDAYTDGALAATWDALPQRGSPALLVEERKLLALLRPPPRRNRRRIAA